MGYPERIVPDHTSPGPLAIHEKRYRFALPYCEGKRVLDGACGVGYGTALLADHASEVVGVDIDADAIAYARSRYARPNVEFRVEDLLAPKLDDRSFDVVCSFETIEHVPDREAYLAQVARVLRDDGVFVVSTPRADETTVSPENPFHFVEYSRRDIQKLLEDHFADVEIFGQRRLQTRRHRVLQRLDVLGLRRRVGLVRSLGKLATGTEPTQDVSLEGIAIDGNDVDTADVIVAVCRAPRRE
jgi:SAM-dependent methyltransferase